MSPSGVIGANGPKLSLRSSRHLDEDLDLAAAWIDEHLEPSRHRVLEAHAGGDDPLDREGAARAGVGFYGKNTVLITRKFGSWVVLGTLVSDTEIEASAPLALDCGSCTRCIDACPTGALDDPGVLDSTRCLSYWTQAPGSIPEEYRAELGAQVYGCDICQDVCPWNRGVEKRRAGEALPGDAEPVVSLLDWLEAPAEELRTRYDRLYFPRNDARYLRRNALVAAGNSGDPSLAEAVDRYRDDPDEMVREHALWAAERLSG